MILSQFLVAVVGFEQDVFVINEGVGLVEVCIELNLVPLERNISVYVTTFNGTAEGIMQP